VRTGSLELTSRHKENSVKNIGPYESHFPQVEQLGEIMSVLTEGVLSAQNMFQGTLYLSRQLVAENSYVGSHCRKCSVMNFL
jgi:hypothetical protein